MFLFRLEEASHRQRREHVPKPVLNLYEQGTRSSSGSKSPMPMETNGQSASNASSSGVHASNSQDPWNNTAAAQDPFSFSQPPPSYSSVTNNGLQKILEFQGCRQDFSLFCFWVGLN